MPFLFFQVKKFITKDAVIFPIEVEFDRHYEDDSGTEQVKKVKKSLYPPMNAFSQKKVLTFNKFTTDFDFKVHYGDMEHISKEASWVGPTLLSKTEVSGVEGPLEKHKDIDSKGIKAHFNLDDSGLIHVTSVESVFEKTITVEEQEKAEAEKEAKEAEKLKAEAEKSGEKNETEDSWAKLGDTISNFFGEKENEEEKKEETKEDKKEKKDSKKDKKDKKKEEKPKKKKEFKPIVETIKEPLEFKLEVLDAKDLTAEQFEASRQKLTALDVRDQDKMARERALNNLETAVIDVKDKLWQEIYEKSSTEEEREKILAKCTELSDWIDEEATFETPVETLDAKLKELTDLTSGLHARVKQHTDRPEALEAMNRMINSSEHFLGKCHDAKRIFQVHRMKHRKELG